MRRFVKNIRVITYAIFTRFSACIYSRNELLPRVTCYDSFRYSYNRGRQAILFGLEEVY